MAVRLGDTLITRFGIVDGNPRMFTDDEIRAGNCPFDELNHDLPERCWVLKHEPTGRYGCYHHEGAHGLCAFLTPGFAGEWAEFIDLPGMGPAKVNQDELLQIAKARPVDINAIHVFDKDVEPTHTFYFR